MIKVSLLEKDITIVEYLTPYLDAYGVLCVRNHALDSVSIIAKGGAKAIHGANGGCVCRKSGTFLHCFALFSFGSLAHLKGSSSLYTRSAKRYFHYNELEESHGGVGLCL